MKRAVEVGTIVVLRQKGQDTASPRAVSGTVSVDEQC